MTQGLLIFLVIGIAVVILLVVLVQHRTGIRGPEWESGLDDAQPERPPRAPTYGSLVAALDALRAIDPDFSFVLCEDFLYALYAEAHTARGAGRLAGLSPYLSADARNTLAALGSHPVRTVIIGGLRIEQVTVGGPTQPTALVAEFEANYAEVDAQGAEHALYTRERWTLSRPGNARSRPPARASVVDCPNCGAPLDRILGGVCGYCGKNVEQGGLDWMVDSIEVSEREERPPILTGDVEEVGTSDPTVVAPDVDERWKALTARDPALDWKPFTARVELVFRAFHEAWTKREPLLVRPYLSDNLFQSQLYWIDAYRTQHLVNHTDGAHVIATHLCRVVSDAHFDAVTVRVFATGLDYTVDDAGHVVAGSRDRERSYSEYWTLIRGVARTGSAPHTKPECPNCGAALDVNMAGTCAYCSAKVTTGEFDWVLSRIEQDEAYSG